MHRRIWRSRIRLNACTRRSEYAVSRKSSTAILSSLSSAPPILPPKKNRIGTLRTSATCCNRLAPMRSAPFSYFCTCSNVTPSARPSDCCDNPSCNRRNLMRLPISPFRRNDSLVDICGAILRKPGNSVTNYSNVSFLRSTKGGVNLPQRTCAQVLVKLARVNEIVAEPGASLWIEFLDRPVDHPADPRHLTEIGMVAQPDVEGINPIDVERDHGRSDREIVGRQPTHCQPVDDRRIESGADIRAHCDEAGLRFFRILLIVIFARLALVRIHQDDAVAFADLLLRL